MNIIRFDQVNGTTIDNIEGQNRFGYAISDYVEFYEFHKNHKGSIISFYDYENRNVIHPFKRQKNVLYGKPVFLNNYFYFLQGDYNKGIMTLYKYLPEEVLEAVTTLNIKKINTYNLCIIGENVHIISQDEELVCYYPRRFHFKMDPQENVLTIDDNKVYLSKWIENGWDDFNDCASENYEYYEKVVVRDFKGIKYQKKKDVYRGITIHGGYHEKDWFSRYFNHVRYIYLSFQQKDLKSA